ncbi:MAG: ATP phosphoribosyltransferase [Chloroflexi bacterium]|nr:ATP phosphoribosyltransferase [Chloroflexota bacterium]
MLDLVLPKGSLEPQTIKLFEDADLPLRIAGDRDYAATIADPRIGRVRLLRPQEISRYIEEGYFDVGITGLDWIQENGSDVVEVMDFGWAGRQTGVPVKIVLAVPQSAGIQTPADLRPGLRVSTEYPNLTRRFFEQLHLPVDVHLSYGATEAKVPDIADAIVEVTETGSTLRRQGMHIVAVILESTVRMITSHAAWDDPEKHQAIEELRTLLRGVLDARGKVLMKLNVAEAHLRDVVEVLPAMKAPTISRLYDTSYYAVEAVVVKAKVNLLIPELKKRGAEDILELPISKIIV